MTAQAPTAHFVKKLGGNFTGDARLYRLDPPMDLHDDWQEPEKVTGVAEYVVVSATVVPFGFRGPEPETYIFPGTPEGQVADWGELRGSYKGGLDHAEALKGAGYEVTR